MKIDLEPGKYVVAVSGGVDSVVLLHLLADYGLRTTDYKFIVAHFDHGIREGSGLDRQFVAELARHHGLPFYYDEGKLGPRASEAAAREARYGFLQKIRTETGSSAIVTAHHQDDLIETAFINILRGTGRKGLSSLGSGKNISRPLLHITKRDIVEYARSHDLSWREDSTNQNNDYLRNYLRNMVLPKLSAVQRKQLIAILDAAGIRNREIDGILNSLLFGQEEKQISRSWFIALPHAVACEVLGHWLRSRDIEFDRHTIVRLAAGIKTMQPDSRTDINGGWYFKISKDLIRLQRRSSV